MQFKIIVLILTSLFLLLCCTCGAEKKLIGKARESKTIEGYEKYLSEYEKGEYIEEAKESIKRLKFDQKRDSSFRSLINHLKDGFNQTAANLKIYPSEKVLMGTPVKITMNNLLPDKKIILHALRKRWGGLIYSYANFQSDANGQVFLNRSKPINGTYSGIDSLGIFWSMSWPSQYNLELPFKIDSLKQNTIYFYIEAGNKIIATGELELLDRLSHIVTEKIDKHNLVADFHFPKDKKNLPVLILVGGGSKGEYEWINQMTQIIASHGYATVTLPYNNVTPLPKYLENVPLEYFFDAIDWIKQKPMIDPEKIIIAGGSRGGELALLLASLDPDITGVIAIEPSHVVWQGLPHNPFNIIWPKASWTLHGKSLPYMKHKFHWPTIWKFINGGRQIEMMNIHEEPIKDRTKVEKALIKVENINGPILFIAGKADCVWPSYKMCRIMEGRLDSLQFKYPVQGLYYNNTGHMVIGPNLWPTIDYKYEETKFGGTDSANANSQIDSWNRMMEFLKTYFPTDF